jgi:hypothetical protein
MSTKPLPDSFISRETVNKRTALYAADIHKKNSEALRLRHGETAEETRCVWFSIKQVAEWLSEMINLGGNGLRIYLGQKEDPGEGVNANHDHNPYKPLPGQLCLMVILTNEGDPKGDEDAHKNIVYERLTDFEERVKLSELANPRSMNAGSYSPPLKIMIGEDYPNEL